LSKGIGKIPQKIPILSGRGIEISSPSTIFNGIALTPFAVGYALPV